MSNADPANIAQIAPKASSPTHSQNPGSRAPVDRLLRRTIRQLNSIGIYDGATIKAVYARRLGNLSACGADALREAA